MVFFCDCRAYPIELRTLRLRARGCQATTSQLPRENGEGEETPLSPDAGGGAESGEAPGVSPSRRGGAGGLPPSAGGAPVERSLPDSDWKPRPLP